MIGLSSYREIPSASFLQRGGDSRSSAQSRFPLCKKGQGDLLFTPTHTNPKRLVNMRILHIFDPLIPRRKI